MNSDRNLLFIGHANPEDNDFTLWLYKKLLNEGYEVECDLSFLIGGEEDYWKSLQELLENRTLKYLLVLSKDTFKKQGVIDEWEQVKGIAKRYGLKDFIYVLKIDEVPFDIRIGLTVKNHFRFDKSWMSGLKNVFKKLDSDNVPKKTMTGLTLESWSKNRFSTFSGITDESELYFSNWLEIPNLPATLYFYRYHNAQQAEAVQLEIKNYPVIRHDNYLITFSETLPIQFDKYDFEIPYKERIDVLTGNAYQRYESETFPIYEDLKRFLVRILKESWNQYLQSLGLKMYELSQKTKCFYYVKDQLPKDKVFFEYGGKTTYKQLLGDFFDTTWHYGISASILLNPVLCISLKAHLLFSDDGLSVWTNKTRMQRSRRAKGKSFFNKEWRGLMLGFIASLSEDKKSINIPITETRALELPITTIKFYSTIGYEEPKTSGRLIPVDYDETQEDDNDEEYLEEEQHDNETKINGNSADQV